MLRTVLFLLLLVPWTLFVILTGVPLSFISANLFHSYAALWGRVALGFAGVSICVEGRENIPLEGAAVYMPNHQSHFDILALFAGLPVQFRFLAKEELFRIPLFGLAMKRCGYISVNRSDRRQAIASMREAAKRIASGVSVILFPEGTRSPSGRVLPFKKGGFQLALQSQMPIVPIAIEGTYDILPKHTLRLKSGHIRIHILPAVSTSGKGAAERDELIEQVRRPIVAILGEHHD